MARKQYDALRKANPHVSSSDIHHVCGIWEPPQHPTAGKNTDSVQEPARPPGGHQGVCYQEPMRVSPREGGRQGSWHHQPRPGREQDVRDPVATTTSGMPRSSTVNNNYPGTENNNINTEVGPPNNNEAFNSHHHRSRKDSQPSSLTDKDPDSDIPGPPCTSEVPST